ncbi:MAG: nucleotidyl transferase AbiEii/AbiGii toxin family protein, partial [Synergistaceae bacterium]|nr:nucleotidyl transferase AbiEii/AbiGii toxin family protein [Synergistaceae bacterium]
LGFVLYGGTAISLYFGHRKSVDFDFFSDISLDIRQENKLLSALPFLIESEIVQQELNARSYLTKDGVKLSFFGKIMFGRVGTPVLTNDNILQIASLYDLLGTKLKTIMQRVEAKDYRDIAVMLKSGMSLEKGLGCALAMYGNQFPPSESAKALTYFHGGDLNSLTDEEKDILISAVNSTQIHQLPKTEILSYSLGDYYGNKI